jgi:hypothetical protein
MYEETLINIDYRAYQGMEKKISQLLDEIRDHNMCINYSTSNTYHKNNSTYKDFIIMRS